MDTSTDIDRKFTERTLALAAKGLGLVSPNPLVGCVIVSSEGIVVGEGYYTYDGVTHAELIALEQAGAKAKGGTAYVSLEPHDHHGKTPPCTEALIGAGIRRVVCPIEDPNPLVSGKGFERLRSAGLVVDTGVLAAEAATLNEKFICWHTNKRPFVHLKLAMSFDGRISLTDSVSTALSGKVALGRVHELRHEHDAILVGSNTTISDNPSLTDRSGLARRRKLVRVILDNRLRTPLDSTLVTSAKETPTLIVSNSNDEEKISVLTNAGVEVARVDARDLSAVLRELYQRSLQSVLVEGGSEVAGAFVDGRFVDKVTFIAAPLIIGGHAGPVAVGGNGAVRMEDALRLQNVTVTRLNDDVEMTGYPRR